MVLQGHSRVILPGEGLGAGLVKGINIHPNIHVEMPEGKGNLRAGHDGDAELRVNGFKASEGGSGTILLPLLIQLIPP